jgi:hypothetical protein
MKARPPAGTDAVRPPRPASCGFVLPSLNRTDARTRPAVYGTRQAPSFALKRGQGGGKQRTPRTDDDGGDGKPIALGSDARCRPGDLPGSAWRRSRPVAGTRRHRPRFALVQPEGRDGGGRYGAGWVSVAGARTHTHTASSRATVVRSESCGARAAKPA